MIKYIMPVIVIMAAVLSYTGPAQAGSRQADDPVLPQNEVAQFAEEVERSLAERGAYVAIVARIGRDPKGLPDGVHYTHTSFWVYSDLTLSNGRKVRGYAVHNLYQSVEDRGVSRLAQDFPADFLAGAHVLDAGVIIPDIRLQKKLLAVLTSPRYSAVHNPNYSVVSNPSDPRFQNCTEHTLDVLIAALYETDDIARIKRNIEAHFSPAVIPLSPLKRALGPVVMEGVETSDHKGPIRTATFGTIAAFMRRYDLAHEIYQLTPDVEGRI